MRTLPLTVLLACAGARVGYAQTTYDADAEAKLIYPGAGRKSASQRDQEPKNVGRYTCPNFIDVDPQGRIENKSDVLEHIQAIDSLPYEMEAIRVKLHKDTAIVAGLYGMKGVERGAVRGAVLWMRGCTRTGDG